VAAVALGDTIKEADGAGRVLGTLNRDRLRGVQTPQGFERSILLKAHRLAEESGKIATDDAALVEELGIPVYLVAGDEDNIKLTTPKDVWVAEALLRRRAGGEQEQRVGHGYDVHRLLPGRPLILCGVEIAHDKGLLGHSDADVALHALCDALLGAAALGDIGSHFPDSDEAYRGISSLVLLERVAALLLKAGWRAVNADVTIAAQRPKLAPHLPRMRENIARALGVPLDCAGVKATTTEGLGFEGEEKGISAQAVCLLRRG
jgi:2-C-methyl-D-erythritol 4-phosphate cytidylyltransferase/2-C-methyl-D-erythritol 2,4-cyclodiphosphate synthase